MAFRCPMSRRLHRILPGLEDLGKRSTTVDRECRRSSPESTLRPDTRSGGLDVGPLMMPGQAEEHPLQSVQKGWKRSELPEIMCIVPGKCAKSSAILVAIGLSLRLQAAGNAHCVGGCLVPRGKESPMTRSCQNSGMTGQLLPHLEELVEGATAKRRALASGGGHLLSLTYGPIFNPEG